MARKNDAGTNWLPILREAIGECLGEVPQLLGTPEGRRIVRVKTDGDPTLQAEIYIEDVITRFVSATQVRVRLHSEERGLLLDATDPEFVILLDPIDGTYLAERGLPGACIGISVHDANTMNPVAAVLGDYFSQDVFWGSTEGAYRNGIAIRPSDTSRLSAAFVSTCYGKASRIGSLLDKGGPTKKVWWLETTGSMLAMARVGTGQIDAYWDLMLGYKPYDFAAGAYIAAAAGAIVTDPSGAPLTYPGNLDLRCKFIIAANDRLLRESIEATQA